MPARFSSFYGACELDRASIKQQLFGKRRFAGIGVRDDCGRAPFPDLIRDSWHRSSGFDGQLFLEDGRVLPAFLGLVIGRAIRDLVKPLLLVERERIGV